MNKQDIFIAASVQDKRVDAAVMEELGASVSVSELRRLIRDLIRECYGWPVADEKYLYGVKPMQKSNPGDPKNPQIKMPKGLNTRSRNGR